MNRSSVRFRQAAPRSRPLPSFRCQARRQDIMRLTQRAAILVAAAVASLAPVATTTAAATSTSPASTSRAAVSACRVTATIPVGNSPVAVAANPRTNTIYVANFNDDTVSVINGQTNTATATI